METKPTNLGLQSSPIFLSSTIFLANVTTIFFFIQTNGSIMQVLWIYWLQSVIIGAVNVIRMLKLPTSTRSTDKLNLMKISLALFFVLHYGGFHFIYMIFLFAFSASGTKFTINGVDAGYLNLGGEINILAILISGAIFCFHHYYSFLAETKEIRNDSEAIFAINKMMFSPYLRIVPMHIIIIFAPIISLRYGSSTVLIVFMIIKTIIDLLFSIRTSRPSAPLANQP